MFREFKLFPITGVELDPLSALFLDFLETVDGIGSVVREAMALRRVARAVPIPQKRLVRRVPAPVDALLEPSRRRLVIARHETMIKKQVRNRIFDVYRPHHRKRAFLKKPPTTLVERLKEIERSCRDIACEVCEEEDTRP